MTFHPINLTCGCVYSLAGPWVSDGSMDTIFCSVHGWKAVVGSLQEVGEKVRDAL